MTQAAARSPRALLLAAALALATLAVYLHFRLPVGLEGQWEWPYHNLPVNLLPALLALLAYGALTWFLVRLPWKELSRPRRALWLALLVLAVFVLQLALLAANGVPWLIGGYVISSPNATTYFKTSFEIEDVRGWVSAYEAHMPSLGYHTATHPPGPALFFLALRRLAAHVVPADSASWGAVAFNYDRFGYGPRAPDAAAAVLGGLLLALFGALGILGVYALSIRLVSDRAALFATVLSGTIPALLLFSVSLDLLLFTLTTATLALSYVAWSEGRSLPAFLAGLVFAVATFFSFGVLAVAGWLILLAIVGFLRRPDRPATVRMFIPVLLSGLAGAVLVYATLYVTLGYHPFAVAREALFTHRADTANELARTYWQWLLLNPVEFLLFAGLPLTVAAVWALPAISRAPELRCLRTFLIASVLLFALLDLSGLVRGEVGRIWLFLMWPLAMVAAPTLDSPAGSRPLILLVLLQGLQAILLKAYLFQYIVF